IPYGAWIDVTNTGKTPIQIPQISVRLIESPIQNAYHYRLIEVCSVLSSVGKGEYCPPGKGGNPQCDTYITAIELGIGKAGSTFAAPINDSRCGIPTLEPANLVHLFVGFILSPGTPNNLIYSVIPELTIDIAS